MDYAIVVLEVKKDRLLEEIKKAKDEELREGLQRLVKNLDKAIEILKGTL